MLLWKKKGVGSFPKSLLDSYLRKQLCMLMETGSSLKPKFVFIVNYNAFAKILSFTKMPGFKTTFQQSIIFILIIPIW